MIEEVKSPETPVVKPLSGLRSLCSYFPHSSRLSDAVINSGLAIGGGAPVERRQCQLCTKNTKCTKLCLRCSASVCSGCHFPDYSQTETRFICRQCYII